ncbi:PTS transporter subunit EIIB, partial [Clostridium butyricum]|nr:PTS transporter subunit EIIB [Clostridium butyricum]
MSKYSNDIRELLDYIGGKDNIGAVSHCATRMRFVLKDTKIADENKIKKIKSVKG